MQYKIRESDRQHVHCANVYRIIRDRWIGLSWRRYNVFVLVEFGTIAYQGQQMPVYRVWRIPLVSYKLIARRSSWRLF